MRDKISVIKSLKNIKLVIGNGFDLSLGLKTSYSDFFESEHSFGSKINNYNLINKISYSLSGLETEIMMQHLDLNIWDLFFVSESEKYNNAIINWCNIEQELFKSLSTNYFEGIVQKDSFNDDLEYLIYLRILHWVHQAKKISFYYNERDLAQDQYLKDNLHNFVYEQLVEFENIFKKYIIDIIDKSEISSEKVITNFLNEFLNVDAVKVVDSFNYTNSFLDSTNISIRHVNGDLSNGFFGIDRIESEDKKHNEHDISRYFKSTRRLYINSKDNSAYGDYQCDNAIIIGHSLNKQDYGYFYYLFDDMKISDPNASNKIVFVCNIYKRDKEDSIRNELVNSVRDLINSYSIEHLELKDTHLFDILTINGRLIIGDFVSEGLAEAVVK